MSKVLCTCCEENVAHPDSKEKLCVDCWRPTHCAAPYCTSTVEASDWEPGDPTHMLCERCQKLEKMADAMEELEDKFLAVVKNSSWEIEGPHVAGTGSLYYTLTRGAQDCGGEYCCAEESLEVRVSDHAAVYCREDLSLVPEEYAGLDDHTLANLQARLNRAPCCGCDC